MKQESLMQARSGAITGFKSNIPLLTTDEMAGYRVVKVLGLVRGNTIRARHIGHDFKAALRHIIGGEITEYTKLMAESREQSMDRMMEQAINLGANAVLSVRFTTSMIMNGAAEILVYGTAVVVEKV